jgi:hypothetical protein
VHTPGFASVHTREWPLHVRSGRRLKKKWMSIADVAATKASIMLRYHMLGGLRGILDSSMSTREIVIDLLLYPLKKQDFSRTTEDYNHAGECRELYIVPPCAEARVGLMSRCSPRYYDVPQNYP